jgi:hypothetical protein
MQTQSTTRSEGLNAKAVAYATLFGAFMLAMPVWLAIPAAVGVLYVLTRI